jgi:hypothetical protein
MFEGNDIAVFAGPLLSWEHHCKKQRFIEIFP